MHYPLHKRGLFQINKSYIWMTVFIMLISTAFAMPIYKNPTGQSFVYSPADYLNCLMFIPNVSHTIPFNVSTASNCNEYRIFNFTGDTNPVDYTVLARCTISGNNCYFSSPYYELIEGNEYALCVIPIGTCNTAYEFSTSYPIAGSSLSWTGTAYDSSGIWVGTTGGRGGIYDFWVNSTITPPPAPMPFINIFLPEDVCFLDKSLSYVIGYGILLIILIGVWLINTLLIRIPFFGCIIGIGLIFATLSFYACNTWIGLIGTVTGLILMASDFVYIISGNQLTGNKRY